MNPAEFQPWTWIGTFLPLSSHTFFKPSTSCQNQVSNSWLIKVSVLKSLTISPLGGTLSHGDTLAFDVCFPGSKPLTAQYSPFLLFKTQMHSRSLRHAGSHMRPLPQKNIIVIWSCLRSSCAISCSHCFSLSSALTACWWNNGGVGHATTKPVDTAQIDGIAV